MCKMQNADLSLFRAQSPRKRTEKFEYECIKPGAATNEQQLLLWVENAASPALIPSHTVHEQLPGTEPDPDVTPKSLRPLLPKKRAQ